MGGHSAVLSTCMPGPRVEESKHLLVVLHRPAKDNLRRSTRALLLRTQEQRHDLGGSEGGAQSPVRVRT